MAARTKPKGTPLPPANPRRRWPRTLETEFLCDRRSLNLQLQQCLTDYVNANALKNKSSPCFNCVLGLENRVSFAKGRI